MHKYYKLVISGFSCQSGHANRFSTPRGVGGCLPPRWVAASHRGGRLPSTGGWLPPTGGWLPPTSGKVPQLMIYAHQLATHW